MAMYLECGPPDHLFESENPVPGMLIGAQNAARGSTGERGRGNERAVVARSPGAGMQVVHRVAAFVLLRFSLICILSFIGELTWWDIAGKIESTGSKCSTWITFKVEMNRPDAVVHPHIFCDGFL